MNSEQLVLPLDSASGHSTSHEHLPHVSFTTFQFQVSLHELYRIARDIEKLCKSFKNFKRTRKHSEDVQQEEDFTNAAYCRLEGKQGALLFQVLMFQSLQPFYPTLRAVYERVCSAFLINHTGESITGWINIRTLLSHLEPMFPKKQRKKSFTDPRTAFLCFEANKGWALGLERTPSQLFFIDLSSTHSTEKQETAFQSVVTFNVLEQQTFSDKEYTSVFEFEQNGYVSTNLLQQNIKRTLPFVGKYDSYHSSSQTIHLDIKKDKLSIVGTDRYILRYSEQPYMYLSHYFKPLPVKTKEGHRLSSLDTLSYNEEDGITMNVPFLFAQSLLSCLEQTKIYADDKILIKTYGYKPCFVEHQSNSTAVDRWSEYLLRYHISRVEFRKEGVWRFVIEPFHGEIFPNYPSVIRQCPVAKAVVF